MHKVAVFVIPLLLVLLELFAGAELFPDAEDAGEDTVGRNLEDDTVIGADRVFDA